MDEATELNPQVLELFADFDVQDNEEIALPKAKLLSWAERFGNLEESPRKQIAGDLVVLAARFLRLEKDTALAVAQLVGLASVLLGSEQRAMESFEASGVDTRNAASLIGQQTQTKQPGNLKNGEAAASMLGLLQKK